MLDPLFPLYSAGSRRCYEFAAAAELDLLTAEVRRTIAALGVAIAPRIAKGQATAAEAAALAGAWAAIRADLVDGPRNIANHAGILAEFQVNPINSVRWETKVAAMRREIETRREYYPALVAKGQLTHDQAKAQLERLEAVHDLYWGEAFAFDGTREELRAHSAATTARILELERADAAPRKETA